MFFFRLQRLFSLLHQDEWQAKRRAAYDRRQVPKVAGSAGGSGGSGVPCGIGTLVHCLVG